MTINGARHIERTSVMKQFESVLTRGLVVAALCLTAGIAEPGRAEETTHGTGKVTDLSAFRAAPDAGVAVTGAPSGQSSDALSPEPAAGRAALTQPGCTICLGGTGSIQWNGASGSFHVDTITNNRSSGTSGSLDLRVALTSSFPVYGSTLTSYSFSDAISLNPLAAGFMYNNVNSGTVAYHPSSIPSGLYWALLYLREYQGGGVYQYNDWIVMNDMVSCNGSGCSVVSICTEDAYTMCLIGGRYRVTSRWQNQYAGGATATLSKAKLTDATGAFWLYGASTYEYMIRISTGTDNGRAWVAIPTFTSVEFWVTVTDTVGGQSKEYHSLPGNVTLIYDPFFFVYP
jgi:hypothetical protein